MNGLIGALPKRMHFMSPNCWETPKGDFFVKFCIFSLAEFSVLIEEKKERKKKNLAKKDFGVLK